MKKEFKQYEKAANDTEYCTQLILIDTYDSHHLYVNLYTNCNYNNVIRGYFYADNNTRVIPTFKVDCYVHFKDIVLEKYDNFWQMSDDEREKLFKLATTILHDGKMYKLDVSKIPDNSMCVLRSGSHVRRIYFKYYASCDNVLSLKDVKHNALITQKRLSSAIYFSDLHCYLDVATIRDYTALSAGYYRAAEKAKVHQDIRLDPGAGVYGDKFSNLISYNDYLKALTY